MDRPVTRTFGRRALGVALILAASATAACAKRTGLIIGVAVPLAGRDAGRGLMVRSGVALAVDDLRARGIDLETCVRDTARHFVNPHEDEGRDDAETPASAARAVDTISRSGTVAIVGGLREPIAGAMSSAARRAHVVFIALDHSLPQSAPAPDFMRQFHDKNAEMPSSDALAAYRTTMSVGLDASYTALRNRMRRSFDSDRLRSHGLCDRE